MSQTVPIYLSFQLSSLTFPLQPRSILLPKSPLHSHSNPIKLDQLVPQHLIDAAYTIFDVRCEVETISDQHMNELLELCMLLGIDADAFVLPRFKILDSYEQCEFCLKEYDRQGSVRFSNGQVHIRVHSPHEKLDKILRYSVTPRGFKVLSQRPILLMPKEANLIGKFSNQKDALFVNKTPQKIHVPQ